MLSEQEIRAAIAPLFGTRDALEFAMSTSIDEYRAIIAAYQAKLLAEAEMPEPVAFSHECELDYINNHAGRAGEILPFKHNPDLLNDDEFLHIYTKDQLQQYAAACAAQARMKALDEAMLAVNSGVLGHGECAAAIESLKGKQA